MTSFSIPLLVGSVALALCPAIPAQNGYHLEFGDGQGHDVTILVNDAKIPIEAYFLSWRCGDHEDVIGGWSAGDTLGGWSAGETLAGLSGSFRIMSPTGTTSYADAIAPGEKAIVGNHSCDTTVDAVLLADGTWSGDELVARGLKAWRDGLVASIDEWIDFLTRDGGAIQPLESLKARARALRQKDFDRAALYPFDLYSETGPPVLYQYYSAKGRVDASLAEWFDPTRSWPVKAPPEALTLLRGWKAKIDGNKAMQELESVFPRITPATEWTASNLR